MSRRRALLAGGAVVLALGAVLLLSRPAADPYDRPALDPRGTGPGGTAALVELLRAEGASVRLGGLPGDSDDVVVQLRDTLGGEPSERLDDWVDDGGTLVVTDSGADLAPREDPVAIGTADRPGPGCELVALRGVGPVGPDLPATFVPGSSSSSCYLASDLDGGEVAAVDVRRRGAGLVVALSVPDPLTNGSLGRDDNAVLATALVGPAEGVRVRILDPNRFLADSDDVGDGTVLGALPPRGSQAVSQVVVAFLVWAVVSARRLGRPVVEELPVPLPASDLVLASGRLLDRNGDVGDAAERLRRRARRDLGVALGLGPDPRPDELADALRARGGVDASLVDRALLAPVVDEAGLVATATHLDHLRRDLRS